MSKDNLKTWLQKIRVMFVLKPKDTLNKDKGNFVDNLRQTIGILTNSCRWVPKTAFQRNDSKRKTQHTLTLPAVIIPHPQLHSPSHVRQQQPPTYSSDLYFPSVTRSPSTIAVVEYDSREEDTEIEAEECVLLDEPVGIEGFTGDSP